MPDTIAASQPKVEVGGNEISPALRACLHETIVDLDDERPDMACLRFRMAKPNTSSSFTWPSSFSVGAEVKVSGAPVTDTRGRAVQDELFHGEIVSLEAEFDNLGSFAVVRAYDKSHRLHRGKKIRAWQNKKDSDVVSEIAGECDLTPGKVDSTPATHELLFQFNMTNWEFLQWRARENGFVVDASEGKLNFFKPKDAASGPSPGTQSSTNPLQLVVGQHLESFRPRIAAPPVNGVEVRGWNDKTKEVIANTKTVSGSESANVKGGTPEALAGKVGADKHVSVHRPVTQSDAQALAKALAERFAGTFAEAEAVARGNPKLKAGEVVSVSVGPAANKVFDGKWRISAATHRFNENGYRTLLRFSGMNDRSLLGLSMNSSPAADQPIGGPVTGVVPAIVTDANDPENRGRVKVKFPWLSDDYSTDWCRTVQWGAAKDRGWMIVPENDDEVLVAFEQGDIRRPFVIGGLYNGKDTPKSLLSGGLISGGEVTRRGFVSRKGHSLVFEDENSSADGIGLVTGDDKLEIRLDKKNTKIVIDSKNGKVEIHGQDDISIKSDKNITIEAGQNVNVKAGANAEVKAGAQGTFEASATMTVKGATTNIN